MQVEKREKNRELAAERRLKEYEQQKDKIEDLRPSKYEPWSLEDTKRSLPLDKIDRSVAKMVVMLTPYGGTFPTMLKHVRKKLEEKGCELHSADYTTITHALIAGMAKALRAFSEVNAWFKTLAKLAMKVKKDAKETDITVEWITPNGSHIYQEYYLDDNDQVTTSTNDSGIVRTYTSKKRNIDKMNDRKMSTALAANVVHSLDANIIQEAVVAYVSKYKSGRKGQMPGFTAVHDCIYGPSGTLSALTACIKDSFYNTTVANNPLQTMLELNLPDPVTRDELPILHQGKARISKAALNRSLYLFS
jgi:DNA-directed RNA polymerase